VLKAGLMNWFSMVLRTGLAAVPFCAGFAVGLVEQGGKMSLREQPLRVES